MKSLVSRVDAIAQMYLLPWQRRLPHLIAVIGGAALAISLWSIVFSFRQQIGVSPKQWSVLIIGLLFVLWACILLSPAGRRDFQRPRGWPHINNWIVLLGGINASFFAVYSIMSFGMAPVLRGTESDGARAFFIGVSQQLGSLGREVQAFAMGQSALAQPPVLLLAYSAPFLVLTITFLALIILLALYREELDATTPKLLFAFGVVYAGIMVIAEPVLAPDFWIYIATGRLIGSGYNPYYSNLTAASLQGLPLGTFDLYMPYGPLWGILSAIPQLASRNVFMEAALFKLLMAVAWIGSLRLVWLLLVKNSIWHQCVGIALMGWLPVSVAQSVGEGHNDILMVLMMLLWLFGLERGRAIGASASLAASMLIKYATAPLFVLDLAWSYKSRHRVWQYLPQFVVAAVMVLAAYGIFFKSLDLFSGLFSIKGAHFFQPGDAVVTLGQLVGVSFDFTREMVQGFFIVLAPYFLVRYLKNPDQDAFRTAVLAVLSAMLFGVLEFLWPWYLIWIISVGALVPNAGLSRWAMGVGLGTPFLSLIAIFFPGSDLFLRWSVPGLVVYAFAVLWFILAPRHWFPPLITAPSPAVSPRIGTSLETIITESRSLG